MSKTDIAKNALTDSALDGEAADLMQRAVNSLDEAEVTGWTSEALSMRT